MALEDVRISSVMCPCSVSDASTVQYPEPPKSRMTEFLLQRSGLYLLNLRDFHSSLVTQSSSMQFNEFPTALNRHNQKQNFPECGQCLYIRSKLISEEMGGSPLEQWPIRSTNIFPKYVLLFSVPLRILICVAIYVTWWTISAVPHHV
jgi:hypothetical protein